MTGRTLRMLAVDIDGTLIDSRKSIGEFTRSEIGRVVDEYGVHLCFVTARSRQSTEVIESRLGVKGSYVTFGGAVVDARSGPHVESVESTRIDTSLVTTMAEVGAGFDVHMGVFAAGGWFVRDLDYWALREARNTAVWPETDGFDAAVAGEHGPVYKVMFRAPESELAALDDALASVRERVYLHRAGKVMEIFAVDAVKLRAVRELASHFGIGLDEIIAFGDTQSDVPMLEGVGVGVLMGNAAPSLQVADRVIRTLSNDEDGIGIALRRYFPTTAPFLP